MPEGKIDPAVKPQGQDDKVSVRHYYKTQGGFRGHIVRRLIHISIALVPIIYYQFELPQTLGVKPLWLLLPILFLILLLDIIRICFGFTSFGQREHEKKQLSSFAWGTIGVIAVLLLLPKQFGIPIIWACAFVDPLMGELRSVGMKKLWVAGAGLIGVAFIWWVASYWLGIHYGWLFFMAPITVLAEWPSLKWIDDNALMMLMPTIIILMINNFMG